MTGKLSGDTSSPNNKKLYEKALLNNISVPEHRLPKSVSPPKVKPTVSGGGGASPDTSPKPHTLSVVELLAFQTHDQEEQERKERLEKERIEKEKKDKEKKDKEKKDKEEQDKKEKERLEKERLEKERLKEEERLEKERLEKERLEKERLEEEEKLKNPPVNISFTIVDPDPVKVEPKPTPTHIPVGSAIHTNLSIKDGIQILEQLKTQSNSYTILDTINKILYYYLNNCPAATLDKIFKYIPNDNTRIEMLLEQITLKYPLLFEQSKPMLGGAELYKLVNS
jgi:hypothetical protein